RHVPGPGQPRDAHGGGAAPLLPARDVALRRGPGDRGADPHVQGDVLTSVSSSGEPPEAPAASVYAVDAYSYASRFVLKDIAAWFPPGPTVRADKTQIVVAWQADAR